MTLLRSVNRQIAACRSQAEPDGALMRVVASTLKRDEIRFSAAARQHTKTLGTIANQFAQPTQHARFDHCGRRAIAPGAGVLIQTRSQRVSPDADGKWGGIELPEVTRTRNLHCVWQDAAGKRRKDVHDCCSLLSKWFG